MDHKDKTDLDAQDVDFHEAAIIDENGKEIEITEEMVRKAIHEIDEDAYPDSNAD